MPNPFDKPKSIFIPTYLPKNSSIGQVSDLETKKNTKKKMWFYAQNSSKSDKEC